MRKFINLATVVALAAVLAVSCKKDDEAGKITCEPAAAFFSDAIKTVTVNVAVQNLKGGTLHVSAQPTGWPEPTLDATGHTLTVVAPSVADVENGTADELGEVTLNGTGSDGIAVSGTLYVSFSNTVDLSGQVANSYLVTQKNTNYLIDAMHKPDGSPLATDHVKLIWGTASDVVRYLELQNGKAAFYVGVDKDDDTAIDAGNALIGAYDAKNNLLWSWHIWISDFDAEATALHYANGYTVMSRNLGALDNANTTADERLNSFGLYYEWGRKDPFVGPSDYLSSNGEGAYVYNDAGARVPVVFESSTAKTGTTEYAVQNPVTYITGVAETQNDWLWGGSSDALWGATKTVNDPCPYGWQVALPEAFDDLSIADDLTAGYETYEDMYGWTLTDGNVSSLYMAPGRRRYDNGKFQNIFNPDTATRNGAMEAQPWEGLYWTASAGQIFDFWFDKQDVAASGIRNRVAYERANGLPVRCMKQQ